jgi:hypothetical protein
MRLLSLVSLALLVSACAGDAPVDDDGGMVEEDATTEPSFSVIAEATAGDPIEDGDTIGLHYGCQGGAHTVFSVVATGSGLDGAQVTIELNGMRLIYNLMGTATGAKLRDIYFVVSDFIAPGMLNGEAATLTLTVRRSDGETVVIARDVTFTEIDRCTVMCTYDPTPGTAAITAVDGPASSAGCTPDSVTVTFDFTPEGGTAETGIVVTQAVPPDCVDELGVIVGGNVSAVREDLRPGTGTCSPTVYRLELDYAPCEPICPAP